jgi:hypothetical protein
MLQKIVIYTSLDIGDTVLIRAGVQLAVNFDKEICLFHQVTGVYQEKMIDEKLKEYRKSIHQTFPGIRVSLLVAAYRKAKLSSHLADEQEAILLIAGKKVFKYLSVSLQESPIPFLFLNEGSTEAPDFSRIVFPVDLRRQNRDALKWILYFGKYCHSEIIAIGANDRLESDRRRVAGHLSAMKNLLTKYGIKHKVYRGTVGSLRVHLEGFDTANQLDAGMMVLLGSSAITLLDLLIGLPEEKIIKKAEQFAVLIVNPRRETYLVCE